MPSNEPMESILPCPIKGRGDYLRTTTISNFPTVRDRVKKLKKELTFINLPQKQSLLTHIYPMAFSVGTTKKPGT